MHMRLAASVLLLALAAILRGAEGCAKGTLYLTIDTGSMKPAEEIAAVLRKHQIKATVFVANEKTWRGDGALDPAWAPFWKSFAADGHVFGTHTWRHWYFRGGDTASAVRYTNGPKATEMLTKEQFCAELNRPKEALQQMTGVKVAPLWRAPGGRTTPKVLEFAAACGYKHVGWTPNGFLGDELPSEKYPNRVLLEKSLGAIRNGDILLLHLGIRSRKDPYWPMLDPLLTGLKRKGFCFATME
jgi:peptidoglycan/xylan/chitin deacetylase (PgdA/CDA1 family)